MIAARLLGLKTLFNFLQTIHVILNTDRFVIPNQINNFILCKPQVYRRDEVVIHIEN